MWILVLALIGVALFGLIAGYFYNRNIQKKIEKGEITEEPQVVEVDSECCGQHETCEKDSLLAAVGRDRRIQRHSLLHPGSGGGRMVPKPATARH